MILAQGIAPRTASARLALVLIGSALLGGCQSLQPSAPAEVQLDGWRVVERVGDARYLAPDASGWAPALPAASLPAGSEVTTGAGGRVILARGGDHISAGPPTPGDFTAPDVERVEKVVNRAHINPIVGRQDVCRRTTDPTLPNDRAGTEIERENTAILEADVKVLAADRRGARDA